MLVLGIDPGSNATGWALLSQVQGRYHLHDAGVIRTRSADPMATRLLCIHEGLSGVLARMPPQQVAIEAIFKHRSSESALRLGHARGVALLVCAQHELPISEYNPMTVKQTVGGHGRSGKDEIGFMVRRLVGTTEALPADAADAAAIAITHLTMARFQARLPAAAR